MILAGISYVGKLRLLPINSITKQKRNHMNMNETKVTVPNQVLDGNWETLLAWGLKPTGEENSLTRQVILPAGWELKTEQGKAETSVPFGEQQASELYDEKGRKRADISINTAVRERAFISICRRFTIVPVANLPVSQVGFEVLDAGKVIFSTDIATSHAGAVTQTVRDSVRQVAKDWLTAQYPDYHDAAAYWE